MYDLSKTAFATDLHARQWYVNEYKKRPQSKYENGKVGFNMNYKMGEDSKGKNQLFPIHYEFTFMILKFIESLNR